MIGLIIGMIVAAIAIIVWWGLVLWNISDCTSGFLFCFIGIPAILIVGSFFKFVFMEGTRPTNELDLKKKDDLSIKK